MPDTKTHPDAKRIEELEKQRDQLAEALEEMRYGHTDKAEQMTVAALAYRENAKGHAPGEKGTANE